MFTRPKPELFDSLVRQNKIVCTKPTLYMQELCKVAAPLEVTDDFFKIKYLNKALTFLLEELTLVADTLLDYSGVCPVHNSVSC